MAFLNLHTPAGASVAVNLDNVVFVSDLGDGHALLHWGPLHGCHTEVAETYAEVVSMLPQQLSEKA